MSDRTPVWSATEHLPRVDVKEAIPPESKSPRSFTGRLRHWLLTDPGPLFGARQSQIEYARRLEDADVPSRD